MATTIRTPAPARTGNDGGSYSGGGGGHRGGGGGRNGSYNGRLGMWFALAAVMMFFMGLTSAFIVRRGLDPGWDAIAMPRFAPVNAAILLASSVTLELARRGAERARAWLLTTWILGALFIAGQLLVWRELAGAGLYMGNSPHSSFVYLLTAAHGLHLLGGMAALSWIIRRPAASKALRERRTGVTALYWHFMDGLWVYLLVLLFVWK